MGKPRARKRTVEILLEQKADEIIAAYQAGSDLKQLSEQFIAGTGVLRRLLLRHGVTLRIKPRRRPRREQLAEAEDDIVTAYQQGASVSALARQYQVSPRLIQEILDEHAVPRHTPPAQTSLAPSAEEQTIITAYKNRHPIIDICQAFELSPTKLYKLLNRYNIPRRHVHGIR